MATSTITVNASTILDSFNEFYIDQGQGEQNLAEKIMVGDRIGEIANLVPHDNDVYVTSANEIEEVVQPYQDTWTKKGDSDFKPQTIILRRFKIDLELIPDTIVRTYLGFLANLAEGDRTQWPIIRYIWEKLAIERKYHDMNMSVYWQGQYVAPTPGTPGDASTAMDGFDEILSNGLTAGDVNEVTLTTDWSTPALQKSNAVEGLEEFIDLATDAVPGMDRADMQLVTSPKMRSNYLRDYRDTFGGNMDFSGTPGQMGPIIMDGYENWQLKSLIGQKSDPTSLWATPASNVIRPVNSAGMNFDMDKSDRTVKVFADWTEAVGFHDLRKVVVANVSDGSSS